MYRSLITDVVSIIFLPHKELILLLQEECVTFLFMNHFHKTEETPNTTLISYDRFPLIYRTRVLSRDLVPGLSLHNFIK